MSGLRNSVYAAQLAPFAKRAGRNESPNEPVDYAFSNGFEERWENAAGNGALPGVSVGSDDRVVVAGSPRAPLCFPAHYLQPLNAKLATQTFFIAPFDCYLDEAMEIHAVAGNHADPVTMTITVDSAGQAAGTGTALLSGTFDLKATANTLQTLGPAAKYPDRRAFIKRGQRLSVKFTGNLATLSGVAVYAWLMSARPIIQYYVQPNADLADQPIYVANRPVRVRSAWVSIGTIGSDAGAVTLDLKKAGSGTAISGGTSVLSATANLKSSALVNTPTQLSLAAAAATKSLAAGDALGVDFGGTLTAVTDVVVTVELEADYQDVFDVSIFTGPAAQHVDKVLFLAPARAFRALTFSQTHGTANGGALTLAFELESSGAPAAGATALHASTVDQNATANTPQNLDANAPYRTSLIPRYSRISAEFSTTPTNIAASAMTMTLQAA